MKKKKIISKILISIIILAGILLLTNKSQAFLLETVGVVGLGAILVYVIQLFILVIGLVLQGLMTGITGLASGGKGSGLADGVIGLKSILFNENPLTTAAYFTDKSDLGIKSKSGLWANTNVMTLLSDNVTKYYYIVRNLSIAILLFVLLYIAIRMAISTVATDEAKYKKMFTNWVVSLATVFVLQYIMIITFYCNNTLVSALSKSVSNPNWSYSDLAVHGMVPVVGFGEALTFSILVGMEITYLFMYIKRNITLGFLIVIAPLITLTYSIDKIADGRSQALNTWLKEFIFTVLIQPFHCIIYLVLVQSALEGLSGDDFGSWIIYIVMLTFMKEAEDIVKKIFNIQSHSMPGAAAMGTMALGVMTAIGGFGKGAGKAAGAAGAGGGSSKIPDMDKAGIKNSTHTGEGKPGNIPDTTKGDITKVPTKAERKGVGKGIAAIDNVLGTIGSKVSDAEGKHLKKAEQNKLFGKISKSKEDGGNFIQNGIHNFNSKAMRPITGFSRGFEGAKKFIGGKDGINGVIKSGMKAGAAAAAFGMGLGFGDAKAAIGLSAIGYSAANKVEGAVDSSKAEKRTERNEEIFTDRTKQYVEDYLNDPAHAGASEEDAYKHLKAVTDAGAAADKENMPAYERDYLENVYDNMHETYKQKNPETADDDIDAILKKIKAH